MCCLRVALSGSSVLRFSVTSNFSSRAVKGLSVRLTTFSLVISVARVVSTAVSSARTVVLPFAVVEGGIFKGVGFGRVGPVLDGNECRLDGDDLGTGEGLRLVFRLIGT